MATMIINGQEVGTAATHDVKTEILNDLPFIIQLIGIGERFIQSEMKRRGMTRDEILADTDTTFDTVKDKIETELKDAPLDPEANK